MENCKETEKVRPTRANQRLMHFIDFTVILDAGGMLMPKDVQIVLGMLALGVILSPFDLV